MDTITLSKEHLNRAILLNPWDFGNNILYDLCETNFKHDNDGQILAKVLFIGRIYAAAVERRKDVGDDINDKFYLDKIIPAFRNSELDKYLKNLKSLNTLAVDNIQQVLEMHYYLTKVLKFTGHIKRSFSSKYLHFHLPELFFIYDSRVVKALKNLGNKTPKYLKHIPKFDTVDKEYASFYCKCFDLKKQIEYDYNIKLTNRQFDNILIEVANNIA